MVANQASMGCYKNGAFELSPSHNVLSKKSGSDWLKAA
jgi:hypothetical protein